MAAATATWVKAALPRRVNTFSIANTNIQINMNINTKTAYLATGEAVSAILLRLVVGVVVVVLLLLPWQLEPRLRQGKAAIFAT